MYWFRACCIFILSLCFFGDLHAAEESTCVGNSCKAFDMIEKWQIYSVCDGTQLVCFMLSESVFSDGTFSNRSDPYVYVRYISPTIDEVSITPGYKFKPGTYGEVGVSYESDIMPMIKKKIEDGKNEGKCTNPALNENRYSFDIINNEHAWARDVDTDQKVIRAMKKGYYLYVVGHSPKGTCSVDVYSLTGFIKAYNKMRSMCQISDQEKYDQCNPDKHSSQQQVKTSDSSSVTRGR